MTVALSDLRVVDDDIAAGEEFDDLLARAAQDAVDAQDADALANLAKIVDARDENGNGQITESVAKSLINWAKSEFDVKAHPRWPAGTPGGKGGQFMRVGERFSYQGDDWEIVHILGKSVWAQKVAKTGDAKTDSQLIELKAVKNRKGEAIIKGVALPAEGWKVKHGNKGDKTAGGNIVVSPYVEPETHDPSLQIPEGSPLTPDQWKRFGKVDQENYIFLQKRFGKWDASGGKEKLQTLWNSYSGDIQSVLDQAYSDQYSGYSTGGAFSLALVFKHLGNDPDALAKAQVRYEQARQALRDVASAIQWDLYNRTGGPDVSIFHGGARTVAEVRNEHIDGGWPVYAGFSQSYSYNAARNWGGTVIATPAAIRNVMVSSFAIPSSFSSYYHELEVALGDALAVDDRSIVFSPSSVGAEVANYLGNNTNDPQNGSFVEAVRNHLNGGEELPLPPPPANITYVGEAAKTYIDPPQGIGKDAHTYAYAEGTAEASQKPAKDLALAPGDFMEGLKGTRYMIIEDKADPFGIKYVKVLTDGNFDYTKTYSFENEGSNEFKKLLGHVDLPKPKVEKGFEPWTAKQYSATYLGEEKKLNTYTNGEFFKVNGEGWEVIEAYEGNTVKIRSLDTGKEATINPGFKSSPLVPTDTWHAPGGYAPVPGELVRFSKHGEPKIGLTIGIPSPDKAAQGFNILDLETNKNFLAEENDLEALDGVGFEGAKEGDVFSYEGQKYIVSNVLKNGTIKARPPGGKVKAFDPDDPLLKKGFRPDAYVVGGKGKLREREIGDMVSHSPTKVRPYVVIGKYPNGKQVTLLNLETGEVQKVSGGKSMPVVAPAEEDLSVDSPIPAKKIIVANLVPAKDEIAADDYAKQAGEGSKFLILNNGNKFVVHDSEAGLQIHLIDKDGNAGKPVMTLETFGKVNADGAAKVKPLVPKSADDVTPITVPITFIPEDFQFGETVEVSGSTAWIGAKDAYKHHTVHMLDGKPVVVEYGFDGTLATPTFIDFNGQVTQWKDAKGKSLQRLTPKNDAGAVPDYEQLSPGDKVKVGDMKGGDVFYSAQTSGGGKYKVIGPGNVNPALQTNVAVLDDNWAETGKFETLGNAISGTYHHHVGEGPDTEAPYDDTAFVDFFEGVGDVLTKAPVTKKVEDASYTYASWGKHKYPEVGSVDPKSVVMDKDGNLHIVKGHLNGRTALIGDGTIAFVKDDTRLKLVEDSEVINSFMPKGAGVPNQGDPKVVGEAKKVMDVAPEATTLAYASPGDRIMLAIPGKQHNVYKVTGKTGEAVATVNLETGKAEGFVGLEYPLLAIGKANKFPPEASEKLKPFEIGKWMSNSSPDSANASSGKAVVWKVTANDGQTVKGVTVLGEDVTLKAGATLSANVDGEPLGITGPYDWPDQEKIGHVSGLNPGDLLILNGKMQVVMPMKDANWGLHIRDTNSGIVTYLSPDDVMLKEAFKPGDAVAYDNSLGTPVKGKLVMTKMGLRFTSDNGTVDVGIDDTVAWKLSKPIEEVDAVPHGVKIWMTTQDAIEDGAFAPEGPKIPTGQLGTHQLVKLYGGKIGVKQVNGEIFPLGTNNAHNLTAKSVQPVGWAGPMPETGKNHFATLGQAHLNDFNVGEFLRFKQKNFLIIGKGDSSEPDTGLHMLGMDDSEVYWQGYDKGKNQLVERLVLVPDEAVAGTKIGDLNVGDKFASSSGGLHEYLVLQKSSYAVSYLNPNTGATGNYTDFDAPVYDVTPIQAQPEKPPADSAFKTGPVQLGFVISGAWVKIGDSRMKVIGPSANDKQIQVWAENAPAPVSLASTIQLDGIEYGAYMYGEGLSVPSGSEGKEAPATFGSLAVGDQFYAGAVGTSSLWQKTEAGAVVVEPGDSSTWAKGNTTNAWIKSDEVTLAGPVASPPAGTLPPAEFDSYKYASWGKHEFPTLGSLAVGSIVKDKSGKLFDVGEPSPGASDLRTLIDPADGKKYSVPNGYRGKLIKEGSGSVFYDTPDGPNWSQTFQGDQPDYGNELHIGELPKGAIFVSNGNEYEVMGTNADKTSMDLLNTETNSPVSALPTDKIDRLDLNSIEMKHNIGTQVGELAPGVLFHVALEPGQKLYRTTGVEDYNGNVKVWNVTENSAASLKASLEVDDAVAPLALPMPDGGDAMPDSPPGPRIAKLDGSKVGDPANLQVGDIFWVGQEGEFQGASPDGIARWIVTESNGNMTKTKHISKDYVVDWSKEGVTLIAGSDNNGYLVAHSKELALEDPTPPTVDGFENPQLVPAKSLRPDDTFVPDGTTAGGKKNWTQPYTVNSHVGDGSGDVVWDFADGSQGYSHVGGNELVWKVDPKGSGMFSAPDGQPDDHPVPDPDKWNLGDKIIMPGDGNTYVVFGEAHGYGPNAQGNMADNVPQWKLAKLDSDGIPASGPKSVTTVPRYSDWTPEKKQPRLIGNDLDLQAQALDKHPDAGVDVVDETDGLKVGGTIDHWGQLEVGDTYGFKNGGGHYQVVSKNDKYVYVDDAEPGEVPDVAALYAEKAPASAGEKTGSNEEIASQWSPHDHLKADTWPAGNYTGVRVDTPDGVGTIIATENGATLSPSTGYVMVAVDGKDVHGYDASELEATSRDATPPTAVPVNSLEVDQPYITTSGEVLNADPQGDDAKNQDAVMPLSKIKWNEEKVVGQVDNVANVSLGEMPVGSHFRALAQGLPEVILGTDPNTGMVYSLDSENHVNSYDAIHPPAQVAAGSAGSVGSKSKKAVTGHGPATGLTAPPGEAGDPIIDPQKLAVGMWIRREGKTWLIYDRDDGKHLWALLGPDMTKYSLSDAEVADPGDTLTYYWEQK